MPPHGAHKACDYGIILNAMKKKTSCKDIQHPIYIDILLYLPFQTHFGLHNSRGATRLHLLSVLQLPQNSMPSPPPGYIFPHGSQLKWGCKIFLHGGKVYHFSPILPSVCKKYISQMGGDPALWGNSNLKFDSVLGFPSNSVE